MEQGLYHLEAIAAFESTANLNVAGLLWPVYVISAEAEEKSRYRGHRTDQECYLGNVATERSLSSS